MKPRFWCSNLSEICVLIETLDIKIYHKEKLNQKHIELCDIYLHYSLSFGLRLLNRRQRNHFSFGFGAVPIIRGVTVNVSTVPSKSAISLVANFTVEKGRFKLPSEFT